MESNVSGSICTAFQPQLLSPSTAVRPITPRNNSSFELAELYELLTCQNIDVLHLTNEYILIIDKESKHVSNPKLNAAATLLWWKHHPAAQGQDAVMGPAIICQGKQFRYVDEKEAYQPAI